MKWELRASGHKFAFVRSLREIWENLGHAVKIKALEVVICNKKPLE